MKLKVYTIEDFVDDKIIAISECKTDIYQFYIQNNLQMDRYVIRCVKDIETATSYLSLFDDVYVEELSDFLVLKQDIRHIKDLIYHRINDIETTIQHLYGVVTSCMMPKKDSDLIYATIDRLEKNLNSKKLDKFIDVRSIIYDYYNIGMFRYVSELYDTYRIKIDA